jgi:iron complex outermembrane receptor protein
MSKNYDKREKLAMYAVHKSMLLFAGVCVIGAVPTAWADEQLAEIIVTAQKREQRLQDVPIAVDAFSRTSLTDARIETTQDLKFLVPSLQYSNNAAYATPFLRGIGTDLTQPNSDPSVATYIDGAFVASNLGTIMNLLGVERVEVLKGPQGTLFGRNAVAGAINVVTLTPTTTPEATVSLGTGNYASKEATGHVSGQIADNLLGGIYFGASMSKSYMHDVGPTVKYDGRNGNDNTQWGVRVKLVYEPIDWAKFTLSAEHTRADSVDNTYWRQVQSGALGYLFGAPAVNERYVISQDFGDFYRAIQSAVTVREEFTIPGAKILGISNYRQTESDLFFDFDATAAPVVALSVDVQFARQLSQEIQILSEDSSKIKWVGGIFLYREDAGFDPTGITAPILFPAGGLPPVSEVFSDARTTSVAPFGQVTFPLTDQFNLTLGARYTHEKKDASAQTQLANKLHGVPVTVINFPNDTHTWSEFTPRVGIDYKIADTLLYATYSKGFSAGVYNLASPGDIGPVNPELLTSYEVGTKSDFLDGRMRFNTSAYYYDFKDIQVQVNEQSAGSSAVLRNAAAGKAYGLETEFSALVTKDFTIRANVDWEHARYSKFLDYASFIPGTAGNIPTSIDASGNHMQRAPDWIGSLGGEYRIHMPNDAITTARLNWFYNGSFFWDASNNPITRESAYNTLDGSITYTAAGGHWDVAVWGKNLTDTYYRNGLLYNQFGTDVNDAPPRTYGITASYRY